MCNARKKRQRAIEQDSENNVNSLTLIPLVPSWWLVVRFIDRFYKLKLYKNSANRHAITTTISLYVDAYRPTIMLLMGRMDEWMDPSICRCTAANCGSQWLCDTNKTSSSCCSFLFMLLLVITVVFVVALVRGGAFYHL